LENFEGGCAVSLPESLNIALKEWRVVCDALAEGRQMLMLRKGGIYESGGEFEVEHRQFLFFPTYVHQNPLMLKSDIEVTPTKTEPNRAEIFVAGEITDIIQMKSREAMDMLYAEHIWTAPLIDMRFNYRPENPLYLLLIRAYRLPEPIEIENTLALAGCKSWVPLEESISTESAVPAMDDGEFNKRREIIMHFAQGS
jgi:hypothetical protein